MLSALIYLNQAHPDELLPANPGVLFSKLVRALWVREERRRERCRLPSGAEWTRALPALASLALALVEGSGSEDVPVIQVAARLGDELFRAAVEASLLVQNGNFVRFQHALMGMYFAAEALAEADVETLDRWCRANVRQWEAIAVAWSGISSRAEEFLVHSNWQDAAELIGLGFVASETALKKHVARALEDLSVDHWRSFQPAMDALIRMGPPAVPLLIDAFGDANGDLRAKLAFVLGRIPDPRAASPLLASLDDFLRRGPRPCPGRTRGDGHARGIGRARGTN